MAEYAKCPFFKQRCKNKIYCVDKTLKFDTSSDALKFIEKICGTFNYAECPRAKRMAEKLEKEEPKIRVIG